MNIFFDIGANVGQTFDWHLIPDARYMGWTVYCFEPSPRNLGALITKVEHLSSMFKIAVYPFAIGRPGVRPLFEKKEPCADSLHFETWRDVDIPNALHPYSIMVPVLTLSEIITKSTRPSDTLEIKIDVEGEEYAIIEDLLQHRELLLRVRKLWVEWHGVSPGNLAQDQANEADLMRRLSEAGVSVHIWPH